MNNATIVFDLDGTLVDTAPDLVAATNHALATLDLPAVGENLMRPWISFGARRMIVEALNESKFAASSDVVDDLLARFLDHYEDNIAVHSKPYPGVLEAIAHLRDVGSKLAICTNKREALSQSLLSALGMLDSFHALVGRDTLEVCKPHPGHVTGAIAAAGGEPGHALMIGDSEVDIAAAKAAGLPVVAVTFGYSQVPVESLEPNALIDHYDALLPVIRCLLPRC